MYIYIYYISVGSTEITKRLSHSGREPSFKLLKRVSYIVFSFVRLNF